MLDRQAKQNLLDAMEDAMVAILVQVSSHPPCAKLAWLCKVRGVDCSFSIWDAMFSLYIYNVQFHIIHCYIHYVVTYIG